MKYKNYCFTSIERYNNENYLTSISGGTLTARYVFDGDGRRVLSVAGDTRTLYVNEYFEVTMENDVKVNQDLTIVPVDVCENRYCFFMPLMLSQREALGMSNGNFGMATLIPQGMQPDNANVTWRVYYPGGGHKVQTTTGDVLSYLVQDHLNSTSLTINTSGTITGEMVFSAWGKTRYSVGAAPTGRLYTGQYEDEAVLYFYNARWYDNQLGRSAQADSIIPDPGSPQSWDRFAYVKNNPVRYNDPSGHDVDCGIGESGCRQRIKVEKAESLLSKIAQKNYYTNWDDLNKKEQKTLVDIGWDSITFNMSDYAISPLSNISGTLQDPLLYISLVVSYGLKGPAISGGKYLLNQAAYACFGNPFLWKADFWSTDNLCFMSGESV
jgi:RHS repeat-associated protein